MTTSALVVLALTVGWLAWVQARLRFWLHIFQLEDYENLRLLRWASQRPKAVLDGKALVASGTVLVLSFALWLLKPGVLSLWLPVAVWIAALAFFLQRQPEQKAKKPLVMTPRAWRLLITALLFHPVIAAALASLSVGAAFLTRADLLVFYGVTAMGITSQVTPFLLILANLILWPVEEVIRRVYLRDAASKIRSVHPRIIAVTGSYGKTTTKEIIAHVLSTRYKVLKTPGSYNTLMGVCKVIRGSLLPEHDFFVVEMGAYRKKSIAKVCRLAPPTISVITTIGMQHLERFRSLENIKLAKAEIINSLPREGVAVLNGDNQPSREVETQTRAQVVRFGLGLQNDLDYRATGVRYDSEGVEFVLHARKENPIKVQSRLLGRHNIMNILAAAAVAHQSGFAPEEISRAVSTLEPVPHRLSPMKGAGGVTIIDDAYNANPEGAVAALETLREFAGRKILITPGLVELGEREVQENRKLGALAAQVCDVVLLVGREQTSAVQKGLRESGFDPARLRVFQNSREAIQHLWKIARPGDVILFENDLPDQYNEGHSTAATGREAHAKA